MTVCYFFLLPMSEKKPIWSESSLDWQHNSFYTKHVNKRPWLVWFSGLSADLRTTGLLVRFPDRAHAWVAAESPVGDAWEATTH